MSAKLSKIFLIVLMFLVWGLSSRAQQAPQLVSPNTSNTQTPSNTAAMASISGTISNGRTGEPLRKASVSLRQVNGGGRGGQGNNQGGGRGGNGGGNGGNGQGPNANAQLGQQALGGALPGG